MWMLKVLKKKDASVQKLAVYCHCVWLPIFTSVFQHRLSVITFLFGRD